MGAMVKASIKLQTRARSCNLAAARCTLPACLCQQKRDGKVPPTKDLQVTDPGLLHFLSRHEQADQVQRDVQSPTCC